MLVRRAVPSLLASVLVVACHSSESPTPPGPAPVAARAAASTETAVRKFGASVPPGEAVTLGKILSAPEEYASHSVTLEAEVRRNCTRRGCWMELADGMDPSLPGCRVTFKDYGFFVPLDSAGSHARVEGVVQVETVPPEQVAHLESEGAKFAAKQADGSAREVRLVANGVELRRDKT